jgi:hypothetical protein
LPKSEKENKLFSQIAYHLFKNQWRKVWADGFDAGLDTQKARTLAELRQADPSHPLYQWSNPTFRLGYEYAMSIVTEENK